jgi:hypothetical protein
VKNELVIKLGDYKIVANIYDMDCPEFPPEITIQLVDNIGIVLQDICLVRPHYTINEAGVTQISDKSVDCIVWADHENEDYTHKHIIEVHKWEEE